MPAYRVHVTRDHGTLQYYRPPVQGGLSASSQMTRLAQVFDLVGSVGLTA